MSGTVRVFSGMQPTGGLHVGNWLGALRGWVKLLDEPKYEPLFCVVDAHAITIDYDPKLMPARVLDTASTYIAGGLDPDRCTLFVQSAVQEHMELAWYLGAVTAMGDLNRMTQFKEKSEEHKQNVNAGLFTYPILMSADILLYRASIVPVGDDQVQHLELSREICRRFNARFGDVFPEPKPLLSTTPRIMGLDGKSKMSKSRNNTIDLFDSPKVVEKKLKSAFTDPQKLRLGDPGRPEICNIFTMHRALSTPEAVADVEAGCSSGALACGDCKMRLRDAMLAELNPMRERGEALRANPKRVLEVLGDGASRARSIARNTMRDVRQAMGLELTTGATPP
jgi:tryptophanyl-tRNA synthetase